MSTHTHEESELQSSCLCGGNFNHWAVSSTPKQEMSLSGHKLNLYVIAKIS